MKTCALCVEGKLHHSVVKANKGGFVTLGSWTLGQLLFSHLPGSSL